jgi:hypothetical protein
MPGRNGLIATSATNSELPEVVEQRNEQRMPTHCDVDWEGRSGATAPAGNDLYRRATTVTGTQLFAKTR